MCGLNEDRNRRDRLQVNFDMLMGEGAFRDLNTQLTYPEQAYRQINEAALKAWKNSLFQTEKLKIFLRSDRDLMNLIRISLPGC